MTEDKMVTVPRADIEFVVQIANRNEWSREGDRLAALLSAPHKDIGGEVKVVERFRHHTTGMTMESGGKWVRYSDHAATVERLTREIDRCHERLEIDHEFVLPADKPADTVDDLIRREIPIGERSARTDGIEARDATIAVLDEENENLQAALTASEARVAELTAALTEIARSDDVENALDPEKNKNVARAALASGEK